MVGHPCDTPLGVAARGSQLVPERAPAPGAAAHPGLGSAGRGDRLRRGHTVLPCRTGRGGTRARRKSSAGSEKGHEAPPSHSPCSSPFLPSVLGVPTGPDRWLT